jgi:Mrp family chromosome partitioning ATPase
MSDAMTTTSLDEIDAAFVGRWQRDRAGSGAVQVASRDLEDSVHMLVELVPTPSPPLSNGADEPSLRCAHILDSREAVVPAGGGSVVDRLLRAAWSEWNGLAAHVEAARLRGRRVCAVAGGEPREGRTTLVECLAAVLRERGRDVSCATPQELAAAAASDSGHSHDKRIVLVDAGIWFPTGPIRRHWLARSVVGSEAAILVRRADRPSAAARHTVLESLGIEVLGEVLTFTDDVPSAATESAS